MRHVKESSGKQLERGIGSGKGEAHEFESFWSLSPQLETVCEGTNPFERWKLEFPNVQISDSGHLEKVFKNMKGKVIIAEDAPPLWIDAFKTNTLIWGMFFRHQ